MAHLSDGDVLTISRYPLSPRLEPLRESLQAVATPNKSKLVKHDTRQKQELSQDDHKENISSLIGTLQVHPVAKKLRSQTSTGTIAGDLASVFLRLDSDDCDLQPFLPLVTLVANSAADVEVWKAVLDLLSSLSRVTPPATIPSTFGATPRTFNSASQQSSEQTKLLLQPLLREELKHRSYIEVQGFYEKYFEGKTWFEESQRIMESVGNHLNFPENPTEDAVWQWLSKFQEDHLTSEDIRGVYYTTRSKADLTGSQTERQLDVLMKSRDTTSSGKHHWSDVRVIGEHMLSIDRSRKFLQLARYARDVFYTQPTRLFVHGFLLLGTTMELHVFDRSGAFSSSEIDILKKPEQFVRALAGYVLMSDEELGLDTFIERRGKRKFATFIDDELREERQLELRQEPIVANSVIAGRATSCYRTVDGTCVVKFSWQPEKRISEMEHMRAAHKIKGVAQLVGYKRVTSTKELRQGLVFDKKRRFQSRFDQTVSSISQPQTTSLHSRQDIIREGKRSASRVERLSSKKSRSNSQASRLSLEYRGDDSDKNDNDDGLTPISCQVKVDEEKFKNRTLSCLAISPPGRPLEKYKNVPELLRALRDAIRAHKSLYEDAKILHRDISKNNIIITDPESADGFTGTLIDMDMATRIDQEGNNERTGAHNMTGTLEFMAIEVLRSTIRDIEHTYRHDLESFFYVFLSVCINYGWPDNRRPMPNPLRSWCTLPIENILTAKRGHMLLEGFEDIILPNFSPTFQCVKDLARSLRDILFSKGGLYTGTPKDYSRLYSAMVSAFDDVIRSSESAGLSQDIASHHLFDSSEADAAAVEDHGNPLGPNTISEVPNTQTSVGRGFKTPEQKEKNT